MSEPKDGGPAFPTQSTQYIPLQQSTPGGGYYSGGGLPQYFTVSEAAQAGMSLRDYFAAKATVGLLASGQHLASHIPGMAYDIADAMLKAREANHDRT